MISKTPIYIFHINGMHCHACVLLIESKLKDLPKITYVRSSLDTYLLEVAGDFGNMSKDEIAIELTKTLSPHGYTLSVEKSDEKRTWSDFKIAIPISLAFAVFFVILQKIGLVNLVDSGSMTYGTSFLIGIIASLSSCMAVVGGLLLSMSATFSKEGDRIRPQLMFHGGRIISFFLLGGVIGALGSAFTLSSTATFLLSFIIAVVMLILGLNLLDVFPWAKKLQPSMPRFLSKHALGATKLNHTLTPIIVGVATFFLPCGFTQSMQLYALTTGNFLSGAITMFLFSLGTLPVLALVSFSSLSIKNNSKSGIFFKSAGLIVIMFAIFNLINSLVVIGLVPPVFNF